MELFLNGERATIDTHDCANLAELVARVEGIDGPEEASVVVAIEVDGAALSPEELGLLESRRLEDVALVRVERRPSRAVAWSVLAQGADYTLRIAEAIATVVDDYRGGRVERASGVLADVLDSLSVLTGITCSISTVLPDEARALGTLQGEIHPWLEEMLEAQTGEDPIRIADLLEYEIAPRALLWGEAMRNFSTPSDRAPDRR